ncbi:hypothetical protein [Kibdelosporangium phytohabitans]|uniref:hypothetical protein n=1 Tax=Kibdelosporangium phytohabitans TaxID=860235 RepID=UPI0012F7D958|nr:hypothetical protein [Kibdelosporangium phytohabitans]MBE1467750.1 hypothetical protein [Kibdelosporangium phytohabitans]
MHKYVGRKSEHPSMAGYQQTVVDAVKPDGTRVRIKADNRGPEGRADRHLPDQGQRSPQRPGHLHVDPATGRQVVSPTG